MGEAWPAYLTAHGFGPSQVVASWRRLGGPRESARQLTAEDLDNDARFCARAVRAITVSGAPGLPRATGLDDSLFDHDGQITKRPIRALTLSALAPRAG